MAATTVPADTDDEAVAEPSVEEPTAETAVDEPAAAE